MPSCTKNPSTSSLCDLDDCAGGSRLLRSDISGCLRICTSAGQVGWFVSFSLSQHKPSASDPHLELAFQQERAKNQTPVSGQTLVSVRHENISKALF